MLKAVINRRAPAGGTRPPLTGREYKGGQFIPAADWEREKALAKLALPHALAEFGTRMQYLRGVWEDQTAIAAMGDKAPPMKTTPGQTRWMMKSIIRDTYEAAFTLGKRAGGNLFAVTDADRKAIKKTRIDEFKYLRKFLDDMENGAGKMDYQQRMDYYVKAARELYWLGFVRANMDPARKIWWKLGPTEHCFPAGTLISALAGDIPIESISVGDKVWTANGYKRVTRLYRKSFTGPLVVIGAGSTQVSCTPNHPVLTGRGWVAASDITQDDVVVLNKQTFDKLRVNVPLPHTNDGITTSSQILVSGFVSGLLSRLPISKWLKPRVTVPVLAISLDNQAVTDKNINDKLCLNRELGHVRDTHGIKYSAEFSLKATRFIPLQARVAIKKLLLIARCHIWVISHPLGDLGFDFWPLHWIAVGHEFSGLTVNDPVSRSFIKNNVHHVGFVPDLNVSKSEGLGYICGTHGRIVGGDKRLVCISKNRCIRAIETVCAVIVDKYSALCAPWLIGSPRLSRSENPVSACGTAIHGDSRFRENLSFEGLTTQVAYELRHHSAPLTQLYHSSNATQDVYNLEVENEHHYYANGILVHNCDSCLGAADQSPYTGQVFWDKLASKGILPQSGRLDCLGYHCQCRLVDETPETEALKRAERPRLVLLTMPQGDKRP